MRNLFGLLLIFLAAALTAAAQGPEATGGVSQASAVVDPAPSGGEASVLEVKERLKKEQEKREQEKKELLEKLRDVQDQIAEQKARASGQEIQIAKLDTDIEQAKQRKDALYEELTAASAAYAAAEDKLRSEYAEQQVSLSQAKYDEAFRVQKDRHDRDVEFIAQNKWVAADLNSLILSVDKDDNSRKLAFSGGKDGTVVGCFPTMDFSRGKVEWHQVPPGATYSAVVQTENPFVVDVSMHTGSDFLACGSTNMLDWDVHIFIAKAYPGKAKAGGRFEIVGVAWPVDLGRRVCWQIAEPPVFEPTPMPEEQKAAPETPEIVKLVKDWTPSGIEGLLAKRKDAELASKSATQNFQALERRKPAQVDRMSRKIAEIKEKIAEEDKLRQEIEDMLREYDEETTEEAPAGGSPEAGAPVEEL